MPPLEDSIQDSIQDQIDDPRPDDLEDTIQDSIRDQIKKAGTDPECTSFVAAEIGELGLGSTAASSFDARVSSPLLQEVHVRHFGQRRRHS